MIDEATPALWRGFVYAIQHTSGRRYIGTTRHCRNRWKSHLSELRRGIHYCTPLQEAWARDGAAAFAFVVLEEIAVPGNAERWKIEAAAMLEQDQQPYNLMVPTPERPDVIGASAATRAKQSASRIGKRPSPEAVAKIRAANTGSKRTPEQCERIGASLRGRKRNPTDHAKQWETRRAKYGPSGKSA